MTPTLFTRFASWVGDFGHPFYDDERQRDVWNEASAFGLQFLLWMIPVACTVMIWLGRKPAIPYVLPTMSIVGLGSGMAVAYAKLLSVDLSRPHQLNFKRGAYFAIVYIAFIVGYLRAIWRGLDGHRSGFAVGVGIAAGIAVAAVLLARNWTRMDADFAEERARRDGSPDDQVK
jgi:hypothetical protein